MRITITTAEAYGPRTIPLDQAEPDELREVIAAATALLIDAEVEGLTVG